MIEVNEYKVIVSQTNFITFFKITVLRLETVSFNRPILLQSETGYGQNLKAF